MSSDLKFRTFIVVLATVVGSIFAIPMKDKPLFRDGQTFEGRVIKLGLDLQGGAEMTVVVDPTGEDRKSQGRPIAELAAEARSVLERRINIRGLKEPVIRVQGNDKILIQLPGIDSAEVDRVRTLLQKSGRLELRLGAEPSLMQDYQGQPAPPGYEWLDVIDPEERARNPRLLCVDKPVIEGKNIVSATPEPDRDPRRMQGRPPRSGLPYRISFRLDVLSARIFGEFTAGNIGRRLAIVIDGKIKSAPVIRGQISDEGEISGDFTEAEARDLATTLRSGSLPCRVAIEGEGAVSYVAATLGEDSIRSGAIACLLSFGVVALFMLVYYRGCGVVAVIGLALNLVFILALMALFGATLTLPGIAGLLLTIGMAVDGNILVYERIREEKEKGKSATQAFEAGHERAFVTIVDSNLTTLAAGLILYAFGTGPIQGFAVTTSVGILTTLFTVLFCCKTILRWAMALGLLREFSMMLLFRRPSIAFTRYFRPCGVASLVLIGAGLLAMFVRGDENYGIDFRGGVIVQPRFIQEIPASDLYAKLGALTVTDRDGNVLKKYPDLVIQSILPPEEGKTLGQGFQNLFKNLARSGSHEQQIKTGWAYPGLSIDTVDQGGDPYHQGLRIGFLPAKRTDAATVTRVVASALPAAAPGAIPPEVTLTPSPGRMPDAVAIRLAAAHAGARDAVLDSLRKEIGIVQSLRKDIVELYGDRLSKPAFEGERETVTNPRDPLHGGKTLTLNLQAPAAAAAVEKELEKVFPGAEAKSTYRVEAAPNNAPAVDVTLSAAAWPRVEEVKAALKSAALHQPPPFLPSKDPFQKEATVGAAVARELKENAVVAAILSWAVIILYLFMRFRSLLYGVAAVVALIHDVLVSIGVVALCGLLAPKAWALNFEFSLQTVAAAMTIIGFSVNDTIVIFDRVRENLQSMRRESLRTIIDASVNQTISRTILTSLTVFLVVTLLYGVTLRSAGGIAEFAFPMIIGVIAGTYSTVYIAAPILMLERRQEQGASRPLAPVTANS